MAEIIISLRLESEQEEIDLEVSSDQPIRECIDLIAGADGWLTPKLPYTVEAYPGRNLPLDVTFAQANVWSGSALIFHPPGGVPKVTIPQPTKQDNEENGYRLRRLD